MGLTKEEVRSAFAGFDSDGSNTIKLGEFLNALSVGHFVPAKKDVTKPPLTVKGLKTRLGDTPPQTAFLSLDRNDDGFVSFKEFMGTKGAFKPSFTDTEAQHVFQGLDENED